MTSQDEERYRRLRQGLGQIVRMRELGPKSPRWNRAWKRLLWQYEKALQEASMTVVAEFQPGRAFLGRLPEEGDLVAFLSDFCQKKGVQAGWISAIGTVRRAVLGYFDQERQQYRRISIENEMEIAACQGNVSLKDGKPFVHLHILLSDEEGATFAGHLFESTLFVGEFWLQELLGPALERHPDPRSGLSLWK